MSYIETRTRAQRKLAKGEHGFILITSLLFLVIITILALSAINSSTLQQKMATNSNDKSQSLQAANSTLAHAEMLIRHMSQPPTQQTTCYSVSPTNDVERSSCNATLRVIKDDMRRSVDSWLANSTWQAWLSDNQAQSYTSGNGPDTSFRITFIHSNPNGGLDASENAEATAGDYYFTITANSRGASDNAPAITQSVYRKRF